MSRPARKESTTCWSARRTDRAAGYVSRSSACHPRRRISSRSRPPFALKAAFCCLVIFTSPIGSISKLVGAVGIENNAGWNFKDLEEMLRGTKTLRRNDRECKGILIGPLMAPRFSRRPRFPDCVFHSMFKSPVGFGLKFRGADGKPTQFSFDVLDLKPGFLSCPERTVLRTSQPGVIV